MKEPERKDFYKKGVDELPEFDFYGYMDALEAYVKHLKITDLKTVAVVHDVAMQGMRDDGVLAIFDSMEKAKDAIEDKWYSPKEIELNTIYIGGIKYGKPNKQG